MLLVSAATGDGTQDYHQFAGRASSVAIDSADQPATRCRSGAHKPEFWKSTDGTNTAANDVTWTPLTDHEAAPSMQPGQSAR